MNLIHMISFNLDLDSLGYFVMIILVYLWNRRFLTERNFGYVCTYIKAGRIAIILAFTLGAVLLFSSNFSSPQPINIWVLGAAAIFALVYEYWLHSQHKSEIFEPDFIIGKKLLRSWYIFRFRPGYVLDYEDDLQDNACSTRFGLIILGASSQIHWYHKLLGKDGWTESQRKALLSHERGHSFYGPIMVLIEVCAISYIIFNYSSSFIDVVRSVFMLFTTITILAWIEELLADTFSGWNGFKIIQVLSRGEEGFRKWFSCGFGGLSHPPLALRVVAFSVQKFIGYMIFLLIIAGIIYMMANT